jgi:hypothetical protein
MKSLNPNRPSLISSLTSIDEELENDDSYTPIASEHEVIIEELKPNTQIKPPIMLEELELEHLLTEDKEKLLEAYNIYPPINFRDQIQITIEVLKHNSRYSYRDIGLIFKVSKGTIKQHEKRSPGINFTFGRPSVLSADEFDVLEAYIIESFYERKPITYLDLLDFIDYKFKKIILLDTLRHIVAKRKSIKCVIGKPMEEERVNYSIEEIERYYDNIMQEFETIPSGVIYNLDETGFQTWVDSHNTYCLVPAEYEGDYIDYPVKRNGVRSSLLVCIRSDGKYLKPLIIIQRKSIEIELYELGFTPDVCCIHYQENGFITTALFEQWVKDELVPDVEQQRDKLSYEGYAHLILDSCTCHTSDVFVEDCLYHGINLDYLPAHTSDQTQPLDLGIFGILKAESSRVRVAPQVNPQTAQLAKMLSGMIKACTPYNILRAFRNAGICCRFSQRHNTLVSFVDRQEAKKVRDWNLNHNRIVIHDNQTE